MALAQEGRGRHLAHHPRWTVHDLPAGHDVTAEAPGDLLDVLLAIGEPPRPVGHRCERWSRASAWAG
ncbi:hypothetical protein [Kitasatospora sp. SUK 42]|uniref:hypothetical protein n=1 Tax=Kitasatospora sp. SUK 42 TaxID=1588882 RepID=UPI0018CB76EF|nr:hypothetical protein [Kitasatospora sp. SUK 42]MBV2153224.1 hypothetical protein [Kitasatospora sp. SUK 42]